MTQVFDLGPAAGRLSALVAGLRDDQLGAPTPCGSYSIEILLDHIDGLARGFLAAARKEDGALTAAPPAPAAGRLGADWRTRIPARLEELAGAWREPAAWEGMTKAGGVELPGAVAGQVALDELVLHGWDLAKASGQPFDCDAESIEAATGLVRMIAPPDQPRDPGLFGPAVEVPDEAGPLDKLLGLSGRDPAWSPA
ncbi:TIGR03086 family metal-binding protein [Amycolatopsis sp. 195334CR]|uniref:TIGR03086 family metal-binding protein n=1 Tax=Amycolatopsis sp. 195334CR TaxID=2814588 RepID=UPI001A8C6E42|nr:TIGR03086 family metal-binding protein [Amycolatopsis sp. 195334CR]MBN6039220.1 TIGR03086 family protein [Amycolatopsis sp. 195334CR]